MADENQIFSELEGKAIEMTEDEGDSRVNLTSENKQKNSNICDDSDIEILLAKNNPDALIKYKKNISKYESLGRIVVSHIEQESKKIDERKELSGKLMEMLYWQLGMFIGIFATVFVYLGHQGKINELIDLLKWFMAGTLGELTAIIFFIVKFLFNNNAEIFKHVKELIIHDNQDEK